MNESMKCVKLAPESVQTIINALLMASSEEDRMAGKYEERAKEECSLGDLHHAALMRDAAANCRERAGKYRNVYSQLVK